MSQASTISLSPPPSGFTRFANLVWTLGSSTKTNERLEALEAYFHTAADPDKIWVIALFTGRRPKRGVNTALLREWCCSACTLPAWLFEECYHTVGDLAETISLLLPKKEASSTEVSLQEIMTSLVALGTLEPEAKKAYILETWEALSTAERFVFTKLITGGFRIGVSQQLLVQALARTTGLASSRIAHLVSGRWEPATTSYHQLFDEAASGEDPSKPYPFFLAYAVEDTSDDLSLGDPREWQAEWKWDGIRGQVIRRNQELFVWSRGEELMTDKFPEYQGLLQHLPDGVVLDGEIMPARDGQPLPFALLQTRIGRKTISKKQLQEAPVAFFAYDLLEWEGRDCRHQPLTVRRERLQQLLEGIPLPNIHLSAAIDFTTWTELRAIRETARSLGAEGLMLKRKTSPYQHGRKRGDWWKWKIDPMTIDAVMIYAQKGHGRRSNLYTDYTFAVRDGDRLVPFTKAYTGLTDKEFVQVDQFVKQHSLEKFGPVRTVKPELVFEIAFEGIAASKRHKSGVALRFPRISRWRLDKKPDDINTLEDLRNMLALYQGQRDL